MSMTVQLPSSLRDRLLGLASRVRLLLGLAPAAFQPQEYGRMLQRFLMPWTTPKDLPDYTITVRDGEKIAARGRLLDIQADLAPRTSYIPMPGVAALVLTEEDGKQTR